VKNRLPQKGTKPILAVRRQPQTGHLGKLPHRLQPHFKFPVRVNIGIMKISFNRIAFRSQGIHRKYGAGAAADMQQNLHRLAPLNGQATPRLN